jgi:glutathione S-transferase
MLKLFYATNTCALAVSIALEEAGASYETVRLDFKHNEQRKPEYLAVNPKGRVPALLTEQGVLTETPALLAFVAQRYPAAELAPVDDAFAFAQLQAFNSYLCSTVHVAHAHGPRGNRWADDPAALAELKRKVPETVRDCFLSIERDMLRGPWVLGERYSVADAYLFTIARWLESDRVDVSLLPATLAHRQRMQERPAVQRALARERG